MNDHEVDVLVVGAGLGGLSTAMFLARQGVRVLVVERRPGLSPYPRAAGQNPRTMELLRIGGVADEVVRADDIRGTQGDFVIRLAQSVRGEILRTVSESFDDMVAATEPCTPAGWAMLSQDKLEPILLAQAKKHGGAIRFDTRLLSFRPGRRRQPASRPDWRGPTASTTCAPGTSWAPTATAAWCASRWASGGTGTAR